MNEWPAALQEIIEDFRDCFDRMERYELLFEYAKRMPHPLPIEDWTEALRAGHDGSTSADGPQRSDRRRREEEVVSARDVARSSSGRVGARSVAS